MHGIERLSALPYSILSKTLYEFNLKSHEILISELLHDILNHIKNIQEEFLYHAGMSIKKVKNDITSLFLKNENFC